MGSSRVSPERPHIILKLSPLYISISSVHHSLESLVHSRLFAPRIIGSLESRLNAMIGWRQDSCMRPLKLSGQSTLCHHEKNVHRILIGGSWSEVQWTGEMITKMLSSNSTLPLRKTPIRLSSQLPSVLEIGLSIYTQRAFRFFIFFQRQLQIVINSYPPNNLGLMDNVPKYFPTVPTGFLFTQAQWIVRKARDLFRWSDSNLFEEIPMGY
jgi:hypothetical protein